MKSEKANLPTKDEFINQPIVSLNQAATLVHREGLELPGDRYMDIKTSPVEEIRINSRQATGSLALAKHIEVKDPVDIRIQDFMKRK